MNHSLLPPPQVRWPLMLVGLIVASVSLCGATVYFSATDPTFSLDHHQARDALGTTELARQEEARRRLGWQVSAETRSIDDSSVLLSVRAADPEGAPIVGAEIAAEIFHHALSARRATVALVETAPGAYECRVECARPGQWGARLTITTDAGEVVRIAHDFEKADQT